MVKKNKVTVKKGGVKSGSSKTIKLSRKLIVFSLIAVAAAVLVIFAGQEVGADTMTKACAGTKGKCVEESFPVNTGKTARFNLTFIDSKTKKAIATPTGTIKIAVKNCYAANSPKSPNGGCKPESEKFEMNGVSYLTTLYKMEQRIFSNGVVTSTKTLYFPGYQSKSASGSGVVYSMWKSAVYTVKDSAGKNISVTVKSPFTYTTNQSSAEKAIAKLNGKTFSSSKSATSSGQSTDIISRSSLQTVSETDSANKAVDPKLLSCRESVLSGVNSAINLNVDYVAGSYEYGRLLSNSTLLQEMKATLFALRSEVNTLDLKTCQEAKIILPDAENTFRAAFRASKKKDFADGSKNLESMINDLETAKFATNVCVYALSWPAGGQLLGSAAKLYQAAKAVRAAKGVAEAARVVKTANGLTKAGTAMKNVGNGITNVAKSVAGKVGIKLAETAAKNAGQAAAKKAVANAVATEAKRVGGSRLAGAAKSMVQWDIKQSAQKAGVEAATKSLKGGTPSPAVMAEIEKAVAKAIAGIK